MLSVVYFYCDGRRACFEKTVACNQAVDGYSACEKIVVSDGPTTFAHPEYKVIEVPRIGPEYNWARAWAAGVTAASHAAILGLDCDRILSLDYLVNALPLLQPGRWVYARECLQLKSDLSLEVLREVQAGGAAQHVSGPEARCQVPPAGPVVPVGKNPMSGNLLFDRQEFLASGGFDPAFEGWGFADTDYFVKMHRAGFKFVRCASAEYHQWHPHECNGPDRHWRRLYNGLRVCYKWGFTPHPRWRSLMARTATTLDFVAAHPTFEAARRSRRKVF